MNKELMEKWLKYVKDDIGAIEQYMENIDKGIRVPHFQRCLKSRLFILETDAKRVKTWAGVEDVK